MSNIKVNTINDASGGSAAVLYGVASPPNSMGFRNRIINGDMRIDQRNAGASVTISGAGGYSLDRWNPNKNGSINNFTCQRSTTAPTGFVNSMLFTMGTGVTPTGSDYAYFAQNIEGFNTADLGFGTASASTVTLSFWVRSSVTGTFGVGLRNSSGGRCYIASYTINASNTWEQKTVTIAGDTSGTWLSDNGIGIRVDFDLGVGSNNSTTAGSWQSANCFGLTGGVKLAATTGATFYITGVQLEAGTVATPFERRDYGRELALCQRYYSKSYDIGTAVGTNTSYYQSEVATQTVTSGGLCQTSKLRFPVVMRVAPTVNLWTYSGTAGSWHAGVAGQSETAYSASANAGFAGTTGVVISMSGVNTTYNTAYGHWAASAEL